MAGVEATLTCSLSMDELRFEVFLRVLASGDVSDEELSGTAVKILRVSL